MTRSLLILGLILTLTGCIATVRGLRESEPILTTDAAGSYQAVAACLAATYEASDATAFVRVLDTTEAKHATVTAAFLPLFIWPQPSFIFEATVSQEAPAQAQVQVKVGWVTWGREERVRAAIETCTQAHAHPS